MRRHSEDDSMIPGTREPQTEGVGEELASKSSPLRRQLRFTTINSVLLLAALALHFPTLAYLVSEVSRPGGC